MTAALAQPGIDREGIRGNPRFRILRVRAVRGAVFRATVVLAAVSIASGAPLVIVYPREGSTLAAVGLIEALMWLSIAVIVRRVPRRAVSPRR